MSSSDSKAEDEPAPAAVEGSPTAEPASAKDDAASTDERLNTDDAGRSTEKASEGSTSRPASPSVATAEDAVPSLLSPSLERRSISREGLVDPHTQAMLDHLKAQLEAVTEQRDALNSKLVASFSRVADLEDDLDHVKETEREQKSQIDILEYERKEHLHALDTGLLVEQSNVKVEMQRLAASLIDEQGKRGEAEEGRRTVENEVDDLAASLFQQANSMVATERLARARAENRLTEAEENLTHAEAAVRSMQVAMQNLQEETSTRPASAATSGALGDVDVPAQAPRAFRYTHTPYTEYILFVQHVRSLRPLKQSPSQIPPPAIISLLSHPFIARLVAEDHEPALRLDFAPGVTFFSKKSISQAIVDGMLVVEPVSAHQVFNQKPEGEITCALSGECIVPASANPSTASMTMTLSNGAGSSVLPPPAPPPAPSIMSRSSLSSASRFFNRVSRPASPVAQPVPLPTTTPTTPPISRPLTSPSHPPIFIFRIAPPPSQPPPSSDKPFLYPVAPGWSLDRLRATCELWRFVKTGIVGPIWAYEDGTDHQQHDRPALPPRKPSSNGWFSGGLGFNKSSSTSGSSLGWGGAAGGGPGEPSRPSSPAPETLRSSMTATPPPPRLPIRKAVPPPLPTRGDTEELPKVAVETEALGQEEEKRAGVEGTVRQEAPTAGALHQEDGVAGVRSMEGASEQENSIKEVEDKVAEPASDSDTPTKPSSLEDGDASAAQSPALSEGSEGFRTPGESESIPLPPIVEGEATPKPTQPSQDDLSATPDTDASSPANVLPSSIPLPQSARNSLIISDPAPPSPSSPSTSGGLPPPPLPKRAPARRAVPALPAGVGASSSISSISDVMAPVENIVRQPPSHRARPSLDHLVPPPEGLADVSAPIPEPAPSLPPRAVSSSLRPPSAKDGRNGASTEGKEDKWEEKTWRELAKVREALFWKRLGVEESD